MSKQKKIHWFLDTDGSWHTGAAYRAAQVEGTIVYGRHPDDDPETGPKQYLMSTSDGGVTRERHTSLKSAKGAFRKYLHNLP